MRLIEVCKDVQLVYGTDLVSQMNAFLRASERYETQEFSDRVFTVEEHQDWFMRTYQKCIDTGRNVFLEEFKAWNFPKIALKPLIMGEFNPLTPEEKILLRLCMPLPNKSYIIGVCKESDKSDGRHETAHGLRHTNERYRAKVDAVVRSIPQADREPVMEHLRRQTYAEHVMLDEAHAYIMCELEYMAKDNVPIENLREASEALHTLFDTHFQPTTEFGADLARRA